MRVMKYLVSTPERGLLLQPNNSWDGNADFEFDVQGFADSEYAKEQTTRRSVNGWCVFLNNAPAVMRGKGMPVVALSVTEAELYAATQCAQDMLYVMRLLGSIGLKVKKPMILWVDNKGAVDITQNWNVGGRIRHVDVRMYFLRELKEEGIIITKWIKGEENTSDIFTKNLPRKPFEKHISKFVGRDNYMVNPNANE